MVAAVRLSAFAARRGNWDPRSVSFRLMCGLVGLFLLTGLVTGGAIFRLHTINNSVDRLIAQDFEPLFEAQNLVQRVQILVALTPKLLNVQNDFELGNLSSQIVDMFNVLDRSNARIRDDSAVARYSKEIDRHRNLLRDALETLIARVRSQLQLNAVMSRSRQALDRALDPIANAGAGGSAERHTEALAALLYQTSLADDTAAIDRNRRHAIAMLGRVPVGGACPPAPQIDCLVDGASSVFVIRQNQLGLARELRGVAADTNLRANQLVYAVANLSAAMRQVAEAARVHRHAEVARATTHLSLLFVVTTVIECGLLGYLRLGVLRRLVALRDSVLTEIDHATAPLVDDGADEIGDLARSLRFYIEDVRAKGDTLRRLAATDPLTGLPNRREFMARSEAELGRQRHFDHTTCVLMMDIDHFKQVNDKWGHPAGDRVICEVAAVGRQIVRGRDTIGRVGGEEYAILLSETAEAGAMAAAQRLRAAVEGMSVMIEGGVPLKVTVSIGLAQMTSEKETLGQLLGRADQALYDAKRGGRNRVCVAPLNSAPVNPGDADLADTLEDARTLGQDRARPDARGGIDVHDGAETGS